MPKRVLSIGSCGFDNGSIGNLLQQEFQAELVSADDWEDAQALLKNGSIDLVLVNRRLEYGGDGMAIIEELQASAELKTIPVMLVSNYPEYQAKAIAQGAAPGFGKSDLRSAQTREKLAKLLKESP